MHRIHPFCLATCRLGWCVGLLVGGLMVAGCETAPERPPIDVSTLPAHWTGRAQADAAIAAHWAERFSDRRLQALIEQALNRNFDLKATAARVEAAVAQAQIDGAGRWPQLSLGPSYQRARVRDAGFGSSQFGAFEAMFNLSWEIDVWGRLRAEQQASGADATAAAEDYAAGRLSLAARVAQRYFDWTEARLQAEVDGQSVKDRRRVAELLRGRFNRGLSTGLDLRLAQTDLANAETREHEAANQTQRAARELEVLLGQYPANLLDPPRTETADATTGESPSLPALPALPGAGLPSDLLQRRPDLKAQLRRLEAEGLRLESARKALLPRITLTAAGGTRSPALTELVDPRSAAWNLAVGLMQPIFAGGRLQGGIRLQQAWAEVAFNSYRQAVLQAFQEVEQALAAEESLREQERQLRETAERTEASRKQAIHAYQLGWIEILTLLDAYRSVLVARSDHLAVQKRLLNNRIDLYLALGGNV